MVRRSRWDEAAVSFLPSWPSCFNAPGVQKTPAPSQIEVNEVRKVSSPCPIGLFLMIVDCGSAIADGMIADDVDWKVFAGRHYLAWELLTFGPLVSIHQSGK